MAAKYRGIHFMTELVGLKTNHNINIYPPGTYFYEKILFIYLFVCLFGGGGI
jgi:hypothetical protein